MKQNHYSLHNLGENISIIVITGGPCSGKTTGLSYLSRELTDRGYKVLITPESATKLILAGVHVGTSELTNTDFQQEILLDIIAQENRMVSIAQKYRDQGKRVVILCDRGALDGEAYCSPEEFLTIAGDLGYSLGDICDSRYHAVIHLRTAAYGAEQFYTLSNNEARSESPAQARELDDRTLIAWQRHSHPRIIDNSTDFEGKMHALLSEICAVLGDPIPIEKEDKFLVQWIEPSSIPVTWYEHIITQDYLVSPNTGDEHRLRKRSNDWGSTYYHTIKKMISPGERIEQERMISYREYTALMEMRKPDTLTIIKKRICFFWKNQFFELDLFQNPDEGLALLEAERSDRSPDLELPPFISVIRDVTNDESYTNSGIARGLTREQ